MHSENAWKDADIKYQNKKFVISIYTFNTTLGKVQIKNYAYGNIVIFLISVAHETCRYLLILIGWPK